MSAKRAVPAEPPPCRRSVPSRFALGLLLLAACGNVAGGAAPGGPPKRSGAPPPASPDQPVAGREAPAVIVVANVASVPSSPSPEPQPPPTDIEEAPPASMPLLRDWPSDFPPYPGARVVSTSSTNSGRITSHSAMFESKDPPDDVRAFYTQIALGAGYTQSTKSPTDTDNSARTSAIFVKGKYGELGSVVVMVGPGFSDKSKTTVTLSIAQVR